MNYQDFQILVNENQRIRASSSQGEVSGELSLDMDRTKQTLRLIDHQLKDGELLKGLGYELYQALFPYQINARFQATIAGAQANNHSVRLRLIFESPELAALPWEFLYDKQTNTFLGNSTQTVLSRYIDVPLQQRDIKAASLPLKVLLVISSPTNLAKLDVAGEEQLIREALGKHIETGDIELDVLQEATIRNINQKLREKSYNVFHFIGHGDFKDNKGYIALVDRDGTANLLDDERFANFFLSNNNLGLVILNSCQGATVSANQVFAGTAPNLVRRGIPAVVAMQYSILDFTAKLFADEFYRTLALGYPVDAAIQETRNAISMEVGLDRRDFATPVLYMRAKDGIILKASPTYPKSQVQAEGLIAYYPFNGNASDQSGNGHNGNVVGAMLTRDRFGYENKAYTFDGRSSYIDLGTLEWYKNDSWTLVAWVETDSASDQMIMSHGTGWSGNGVYVNVFNGRLYMTTNTSQAFDNKTFPLGSWHMVTAVKDKREMKLYRDATQVGLGLCSYVLPPSGLTFQVGRHYDGIQNWQGSIDDIRIYNRALNIEEIKELYHEGGWK
jgi:CHAT domain/Concanavalin A-like lectin/glucanases superfamily